MNNILNPRQFGLPSRTILEKINQKTIALVINRKSRIIMADGRKMDIGFELVCENGTIAFHGERSNEIKLFVHGDKASEAGFKTIHINSEHPDYGAFLPAPGPGLASMI